jgi:hypothetical protein
VAKAYRDRAPRRIKLADGRDALLIEGRPLIYGGTSVYGGRPPEDDRFWAAAIDLDMPLVVHTSFPTKVGSRETRLFKYPRETQGEQRLHTNPNAPVLDRRATGAAASNKQE